MKAARASGAGWQANLIDCLMADYGFTLAKAVCGISITAAFSLMSARGDRLGLDRPGHADHAAGEARERAKAFFEKHYQIV